MVLGTLATTTKMITTGIPTIPNGHIGHLAMLWPWLPSLDSDLQDLEDTEDTTRLSGPLVPHRILLEAAPHLEAQALEPFPTSRGRGTNVEDSTAALVRVIDTTSSTPKM